MPEADAAEADDAPAGAYPAEPADAHKTQPPTAVAAAPAPAAGQQEPAGTGQPASDVDRPNEAPQDLVLAATPGQEGEAPAGAVGRRVLEHIQGPAGQTWVRDDEGTIWAWPPTGGALVIAAGPQTASDTTGSPGPTPPATANPVPGHIRALAGRLIGRGRVTVRIDPPMSADYRDWTIAFVRGYGEEVWLTVPGDLPATVTLTTLHRFEISRGSRVSTGQDVLEVTPGQPASDGQLDDWLRATGTPPAPAPLPGQAALPEDTHALTEDAPWNGPIHPDMPVYRNGTVLTVRFQGPDADQTWQGTAAGIVPGDGPHEPGLLQVVAWETGPDGEELRYSIVHPALASRLTDDPYQDLDPRQRERWQLFDQAAANGHTTASLPGSLLDPGDAVESAHPAAAIEVITVGSVTSMPGGGTGVEGTGTQGTVSLYNPPGEAFVTRIPATRPSAAPADADADDQTAAPAEDDSAQTTAGPQQPEPDGREPATADVPADAAAQKPAESSPGLAEVQLPDGTQPLTSHQPWQGQRRPERLVYANETPLTVRVTRPPEPPAWPSDTRAAIAAGVIPAAEGGLLQVVRWEDGGGYAVVHPALAWPPGTDPYEGLDEQHRRRWLRFDADEARLDRRNEEFATLPASLVEPGDHIQLQVQDKQQVLEVDRLQPGQGDVPGQEIIFKGRHRPLRGATDGLLIPVQIPHLHPTLAAAIAAITGSSAAGAAAAPAAPPHQHLPRHDRVADVHRYTQMVRGQRVTLERAVGSGDRDQVVAACRDAVIRWNELGNVWPEDAERWQDALDQFLPDGATDNERLLLEDLTVEPVPADPADDEPTALFDVDQLGTGQLTESGRPASQPVSDNQVRAAFEAFRRAAAGELPGQEKTTALAHAFTLVMRHDQARHRHPAGDARGDRHEVTYRAFGTDTTLPACCEESARRSAQAISTGLAAPVSAVTITAGHGRREAVFRSGRLVRPAATASSGPGPAASPAGPAGPTGPEPDPAPLCLYGSPARGLAARQAEREASHARQGTGPAASPVHAWRVHPSCPDTPTDQCQTTILSADLRRFGNSPVPPCGHDGPLLYRACCRRPGCDWEGPERDNENTAAEDGCDHAWPEWRDLPPVGEPPRITSGTTQAERTAIARWTGQVNRVYPPGWVEDGGPVRTRREASSGSRHVPAGTPYGGYELAVLADASPGQPADHAPGPHRLTPVADPAAPVTPAETQAAAGVPAEPEKASPPPDGDQLPGPARPGASPALESTASAGGGQGPDDARAAGTAEPDWMREVAVAQAVAGRLQDDGYVPAQSDHDALHAGLVAARDHAGADAPETRALLSAYHESMARRRRQQAIVTRRITAAIRATGAVSETAALHTQAVGAPGTYRIRMAYATAEDLGLTGGGAQAEPRGWPTLSATIGTEVTLLSVTREPEWTIVTIHTADLPAPQPGGRTRPAADLEDGLFPAGPGTLAQPEPDGQDRQLRADLRPGDEALASAAAATGRQRMGRQRMSRQRMKRPGRTHCPLPPSDARRSGRCRARTGGSQRRRCPGRGRGLPWRPRRRQGPDAS